jgi:hypothetical protein
MLHRAQDKALFRHPFVKKTEIDIVRLPSSEVSSALIVLLIFADAILGVNFFATEIPGEFLKFDRAFVGMFRVAAGETWIDSYPVINEDGSLNTAIAIFLFSFILIVNWTLLQVSWPASVHAVCPPAL